MMFDSGQVNWAECSLMGDVIETFERYRSALEMMSFLERFRSRNDMLRDLADLRKRYLAALGAVALDDKSGMRYQAYQRRLLHLRKTIAGLVQLLSRHAVRKLRPSQLPVSLLYRVRQITVTHPAIAPPQSA